MVATAIVGAFLSVGHWIAYNWVAFVVAVGGLALVLVKISQYARARKGPNSERYSQRRDLSRRVRPNEHPKADHEIRNGRLHAARQLPAWLTLDVPQKDLRRRKSFLI